MRKKLFEANYKESSNLVTKKRFKLNEEGFKYMKLSQRIFLPFLVSFFVAPLIYLVGTKMPLAIGDENNYFSFVMAKYNTIFSNILKLMLLIWIILSILFLIQHKNYGVYVLVAYFTSVLPMSITTMLAVFNLIFRASVAGVGMVGSVSMVVAGCSYTFIVAYNLIQNMKLLMYGKSKKTISVKWYLMITILSLGLTIVSSVVFPPKELNLVLYIISFGLLLVFGMIAVLYKILFRMFVMSYYFFKYGEQYKEKFKITDEQWYGPRKAKRLAKKKGK